MPLPETGMWNYAIENGYVKDIKPLIKAMLMQGGLTRVDDTKLDVDFKSITDAYDADDKKALEFGIVENVQRHDLNSIEEAEGYKRLIDEFSYDQEQVAKFIGKSRSHITNSLRLLTPVSYTHLTLPTKRIV